MSWHGYIAGQHVALDDVVAACRKYVNSGGTENLKEKRLWIKIIAKSGYPVIVYSPQSEKGWGSSALNSNNWKTPDGEPIF